VILPQRLEHDPARHAMRDAGLDHDLGPGMQHHALQGTAQRTVAVGVPAVGIAAETPSLGLYRADIRRYLIKPLIFRARPWRAQQSVQVLIPGLVHRESRRFPASVPLVPLPDFPWQSSAYHPRISGECTCQTRNLLHACLPQAISAAY
jgi:hypothetical protein